MARKYLFILFLALLLLPVISLADATGDHPPNDLVYQQTGAYGVVYATIPNWLTTSVVDSFNIVGIPTGSQVVKAFLYLNGVEIQYGGNGAVGLFNGNELPYNNPSYTDDLELSDWDYWCTGYRWDVTQFVTTDGAYAVDLHGPWACLSAFLVVVYENQSLTQSMVSITMGEEILMSAGTAPEQSMVSIPNIVAGYGGRLILFGESLWSVGPERIWFNGDAGEWDVFSGLGQACDIQGVQTIDGVNTVGLTSLGDLLLWKIVVLISPPGGQEPTAKIEAKLDRGLPKIDVIESKLDDDFPQVNGKIDAVERKIDGLGGLNIDEVLTNIAKLEAKADTLEAKVDPVDDKLVAIEAKMDQHFSDFSFSKMESKIDQMGGDLTGGLHYLNQVATAASIDKIEAKLDGLTNDISSSDIGLPRIADSVAYLEGKLDNLGKDADTIMNDTSFGLVTTHSDIARLETKLDGMPGSEWFGTFGKGVYSDFDTVNVGAAKLEEKLDRGVQPGIETIIKMLGASASAATLAMIEAKLDEMGPKVDSIYGYSLTIPYIYSLLQTNTSLLNGLEAKLDAGGRTGGTASLETKLDTIGPKIDAIDSLTPKILGAVTGNSEALSAIEAKIDGSGGVQESLDGIQGTLNDTVAGGLNAIEQKVDGEVSGGINDIKTEMGQINTKIDAVEGKLLNDLLRGDQECLPSMAYTPEEMDANGKMSEVKWFVYWAITNLENMGYLPHQDRAETEWYAGNAAYNAGNWYVAGYDFWYAYNWAQCDAAPSTP